MKQALRRKFNETASKAHDAFPYELARLVIVTPGADEPVYISPRVAQELTQNTAAIRSALKKVADKMTQLRAAGLANESYALAGTRVNLIAVDDAAVMGALSPSSTKEMQATFILDHEIGHHIVEYGFALNEHLSECAADAFAMLRHIQRFGRHTDFAKNYAATRGRIAVLFSGLDHYTAGTVLKAIDFAQAQGDDFSRLSLQQIAGHAAKIAHDTSLERVPRDKIYDAYEPVAEYCAKHLGSKDVILERLFKKDAATIDILCRQTLGVMRKYEKDADIFTAGKRFLALPEVKEFMKKAAQTDSYWKDARAFVNGSNAARPASTAPGI